MALKQSTKNSLLIILGGVIALLGEATGDLVWGPDVYRPGAQAIVEKINEVPGRIELVEQGGGTWGNSYSIYVDNATGKTILKMGESLLVLPDIPTPTSDQLFKIPGQ